MSVKQLEKKVEGLNAKRTKQRDALAETEGQLAGVMGELAAARKSEPLAKAANKPRKSESEKPTKSDKA